MFRHRCRRRQLINRLWNRRLQPNSTRRHRWVNASTRLRHGAEGQQQRQHPEVGSQDSSTAALRNVISNSLRHCCSCWTSTSHAGRLNDSNEGTRDPEADDEAASQRFLSAVGDRCSTTIMKRDAIEQLFDLLRLDQLETLADAVCGGLVDDDGEAGGCVIVSARQPQRFNLDVMETSDVIEPHVVSCGLWRWPELIEGDHGQRLKPMPRCVVSSAWNNGIEVSGCERVICCNPYHWSRLLHLPVANYPDSTSKEDDDVSRLCSPADKSRDMIENSYEFGNSSVNSSTGLDDDLTSGVWSTLAYWEHDRRVGPLCDVRDRRFDVFDRLARGNGLSLSLLSGGGAEERRRDRPTYDAQSCPINARTRRAQADSVKRTREKIGAGLVLSLEHDPIGDSGAGERNSLWLYNRSKYPVFVSRQQSPTSGRHGDDQFNPSPIDVAAASSSIEKLPSGFATKLFGDFAKDSCCRSSGDNRNDFRREEWTGSDRCPKRRSNGVVRRCVKISFVKGWGPGYRRTCITSCPCWLEVLVSVR